MTQPNDSWTRSALRLAFGVQIRAPYSHWTPRTCSVAHPLEGCGGHHRLLALRWHRLARSLPC